MERHIYSISIQQNNTNTKKAYTPLPGMWSASFAPITAASGGTLFVAYFGGNGNFNQVPNVILRNTSNDGTALVLPSFSNGRKILAYALMLVNNSALQSQMSQRNMPTKSYITVPAANASISLNAVLTLPPNFNRNRKYPLLVDVYASYHDCALC